MAHILIIKYDPKIDCAKTDVTYTFNEPITEKQFLIAIFEYIEKHIQHTETAKKIFIMYNRELEFKPEGKGHVQLWYGTDFRAINLSWQVSLAETGALSKIETYLTSRHPGIRLEAKRFIPE